MIHLYPDLKGSSWDVPMETQINVSANMISEKVLSPRNSATVSEQVDIGYLNKPAKETTYSSSPIRKKQYLLGSFWLRVDDVLLPRPTCCII